jgi:hypothetical protein
MAENNYLWKREKYYNWINNHCPENEEMDILDLRGSEVENNMIDELSPNINKLKNLYILSLDNNQLTELPNSFGELDKLEEITLDNNNLHSLPPSIFQLPDLVTLSLKGNKKLRLPLQYRQRIEELNPPRSSTSHMTPQEINRIFSHSTTSHTHLARGRTRKSRKYRKSKTNKRTNRRRRSRRRK